MPYTRQIALMAGVLLIAFVLRIATLDRRPLHFDEGNSVYFSQLTLPQLLQASIDTREADPPAYRQTLGLWIALAGPTPISLRLYSVFYGILTVAALVALLRALGVPFRVRVLAAAILAGAAFAIDYSQQAKGYAMGAAMAALSWWAWVCLMRGKRIPLRAGAVYVISTLLMLGTHYYTAAVLGMQWLWWLGSAILPVLTARDAHPGTGRIALRGVVAQAIACIPIGVWTALAISGILSGASGLSNGMRAAGPFQLLRDTLQEMSSGEFADHTAAAIAALVFVFAAIAGAIRLWRAGYRRAFWFGASLILPLGGAVLLQQRITFFYPRFLLYAMPCLCVLAAGIVLTQPQRFQTTRWHLAPIALGVAALASVSLAGVYALLRAPVDEANDFRPIFARMRPLFQPGDTALGSFIWMQGMMTSYAPETQQFLRWQFDFYSPQNVDQLMAADVRATRRVWLFNFLRNPDARETLSVMWLRRHAAYADRFTAGTLSVLVFATSSDAMTPTRHVRFGHRIVLSYAPIRAQLHRGDTFPVTLNWQAEQIASEHDTVFMHLVSPDGRLVAQNDGDAVNGLAPSYTWTPGHAVVDQRALLVRDDLAPGDYALQVGLYRADNGARLLTDSGADSETVGVGMVPAPGEMR